MNPENYKHIVRIANTDLDGSKKIGHALTKIKGISFMTSNAVCKITGIDRDKKAGSLDEKEVAKLDDTARTLDKTEIPSWMLNRQADPETGDNTHLITTNLKFVQQNDVRQMKKIKSYRGMRHAIGQPVRGQRTRSNFRRNKGKVVGVQKKRVAAPAAKESKE